VAVERVSAAPASGAEGARRVLAVLQAFSPRQHTLTARELTDLTAIPLPSMYRYIALLRDMGLLVGDERGAYHLSPRFISMARAAKAADSLVELADPIMRDLARECGEAVFLVRLIGQSPICVHRVDPEHREQHDDQGQNVDPERPLSSSFEPGQSLPLLHGVSGRVLLAGLPERRWREHLVPVAKSDPAEATRLAEMISRAAVRGWATSEEEIDHGVWAASAAVLAGRATAAALTVPATLARAPSVHQERLLGQVRTAAARLSKLIEPAR
jgi:DNA-binding IclR family transcriptional regulator